MRFVLRSAKGNLLQASGGHCTRPATEAGCLDVWLPGELYNQYSPPASATTSPSANRGGWCGGLGPKPVSMLYFFSADLSINRETFSCSPWSLGLLLALLLLWT